MYFFEIKCVFKATHIPEYYSDPKYKRIRELSHPFLFQLRKPGVEKVENAQLTEEEFFGLFKAGEKAIGLIPYVVYPSGQTISSEMFEHILKIPVNQIPGFKT